MKLHTTKNLNHFYHKELLIYVLTENDQFYYIRHRRLKETEQFLFSSNRLNHPQKIRITTFLQKILNLNYGGIY